MRIPDNFIFIMPDAPFKTQPLIDYTARLLKSGHSFEISWNNMGVPCKSMVTYSNVSLMIEQGKWVIREEIRKPVNPNNLFNIEDL